MGGIISEAATKKRGRPRKYAKFDDPWTTYEYSQRSGRTLQNFVNAETMLDVLYTLADDMPDNLHNAYVDLAEHFIWQHDNDGEKNHFRYQGVAEQIGRMYNAGRIDAQKVVDLARYALHQIQAEGRTSRDVEKELRQYHKSLRLSVAATENREG